MKRNIIFLAIAIAALTSCNALNDKLERYPLDTVSPGSFFKDASQLEAYSNKCYEQFFSGNCYDAANDLYFGKTLTKYQRGGTMRSLPSSGGGWDFDKLRHINTFFSYIDNCTDEAVKKEYTGLMKFFRVMYYYNMVRSFGDVPWIDRELFTNDTDVLYASRDNREVVVEHMIEDIDYAIANLPEAKSTYRVNKWAALQLKSRFLLFEGTWRKYHANDDYKSSAWTKDPEYYLNLAAEAAHTFITESPYAIYNTGHPELDYRVLFATENANDQEIVLAKNYGLLSNYSHFASWYTCQDNGAAVNKKFIDAFLMKDGSRFTDKNGWETMEFFEEVEGRDPRLAQIIRTPGYQRFVGEPNTEKPEYSDSVRVPRIASTISGYQVSKYDQGLAYCPDTWTATAADLPLMRAAEVYLNYAEAKAEAGTLTQADLDCSINVLRKRAGMPDLSLSAANGNPDNSYLGNAKYGFRNVSGSNKGVILEIRRERMVELAQEGDFRWYDLMRWKEGKCMEQLYLGMYFPDNFATKEVTVKEGDNLVTKSVEMEEFDFNHDGNMDVCFYKGDAKPVFNTAEEVYKLNSDIFLSGGTKGNLNYVEAKKISHTFDEGRDYLEPIPTGEIALNQNLLPQNPGWKTGLEKKGDK